MNNLSKKDLLQLSEEQHGTCISFFLPTHRAGMEVINKQDRLVFKNQLKAAREYLEARDWSSKKMDAFFQPAIELLDDPEFWRHQGEGLAVFLNEQSIQYFNLPFEPEVDIHIESRFYLRPLIPVLSGSGKFYVLGLNLHHISFYEGNREGLKEIYVEDFMPQQLEEVVGYDYKERFHQFRSQQEGHGQASFHGHGEWKGEFKKEEMLHFFREIDKKIMQRIGGQNIPLLVMGQEYFFPIYQKANSYPHLLSENLGLNPEHTSIDVLHQKIWQKIYPIFDKTRQEKIAQLNEVHRSKRASFDIQEILLAAFDGKVDTLFVAKGGDVWGVYNTADRSIRFDKEANESNGSLVNLTIAEVLRNGGQVYELLPEAMTMPYSEMNALYRY